MEEYIVHYAIEFNTKSNYEEEQKLKLASENKAEGATVERLCNKCGNGTFSYKALQLRSADEGQTIFYTCTSCGNKETENS